jgi:type 1 glutamine amidotransferase
MHNLNSHRSCARAARLLAVCLLAFPALAAAQARPASRPAPADSVRYTDKIADYGVCRGVNPSCYNNWGAPFRSNATPRVLLISRTAGPRHANLGPALPAGMNPPLADANAAQKGIVAWGAEKGFAVDWTEDVAQLTPQRLRQYNALIFVSNSRTFLDDAAETALMQYMRNGGGFVAIHNPLGAMYQWPYFQGLLGGANYYDHGAFRNGTVVTTDRKDASTSGLPARWDFKDEWYNLEPFPSFVRFLAEVDTRSLPAETTPPDGHPGHAGFHPVSWCQYFDGGRAWITSLGHDAAAFQDGSGFPGQKEFKEHIVKGILSAAGVIPFCTG